MPLPRPVPVSAASGAQPVPLEGGPPASASVPVVRDRPEEEETIEEEVKKFAIKNSPPVLVSAAIHMLLIIILGIWVVGQGMNRNRVAINATYADDLGQQLDDASFKLEVPEPEKVETVLTPTNLPEVENPFAAPPTVDVSPLGDLATSMPAPTMGIALSGRDAGMKRTLLGKYGGTELSEEAVRLGLEWLARQQQKNGSWSLKGPYTSGASFENHEAATAMAMLAFQGAGNTHKGGKYQKTMDAAVKYLLRMQDRSGNFFQSQNQRDEWLYTQGQCTMAICELYGMTHDSTLRGPCELAVKFIVDAQDDLGGWRYRPGNDSDTSVTGWMLMALQSAKMGGLTVPEETLERISEYLERAQSADPRALQGAPVGSLYCYLPGQDLPTLAMTAEGLLCRQYLGWEQDDPRLVAGAQYLTRDEHLPRWDDRDHYHWYYATQVLHHLEGPLWEKWNKVMRDLLIDKQEKKGAERGSWDPLTPGAEDLWCQRGQGGRLYCTCLSLYNLEVYYRHLPLYSDLKKQLEAAANR